MMYDTCVICSPYLNANQIERVNNFMSRIQNVSLSTAEVNYEYYFGEVSVGSFDYRIRLNMKDTEFINDGYITRKKKIDERYLYVECSLHKLLMGHNLFGGPQRLQQAILYLVRNLEHEMDVCLPDVRIWTLERIDVSSVYNLGSYECAKELLEQVKTLKFPYRTEENMQLFSTSVAWNGSVNYHKHYLKYPEFEKHDYKVMKKKILRDVDMLWQNMDKSRHLKSIIYENKLKEIDFIKEKIKGFYRIETGIRKVKLKELFPFKKGYGIIRDGIRVMYLCDDILFNYGYDVIKNLFKDCVSDKMKNDKRSVMNLLENNHANMKNQLFGTWNMLLDFGYDYTKNQMSNRTFYRHVKMLRELGIGWNDVDVKIDNKRCSLDVFDFYNNMINNLELNGECFEVQKKLDNVA